MWEEKFDHIVFGIDMDECEDDEGWWETSDGAEFGRKKKEELKTFISKQISDAYSRGFGAGRRMPIKES